MKLQTTLHGNVYKFKDLKELFGKANEKKSGDTLIGVGAKTISERVAARVVLSELTLGQIRDNPLILYDSDEVTRVIDDNLNEHVYREIKSLTVGELRNLLLQRTTTNRDIARIRKGLNGEMIAAVAKLMTNMDLVYGAKKIIVQTNCRYTLGKEGTLGFRLQPNHPMDDLDGIRASIYEGLAYGCGDACLGINPVADNVESTTRLLEMLHEVVEKWNIPTQTVVLSHMTTQMEAIRKGAPASMIFQSIAGTQKANDQFGVTAELIDEAFDIIKKFGSAPGPNLLYFETGQGSEMSIDSDLGVDEMTLEARTYAFGTLYKPFMVNNVSGFIGPETLYDGQEMVRANLEDHYMGKLAGLSMGMAPCYTNHTGIDQNDQEIATMLLTMAGSNYFIGVPGNDDIMLSYMDTSYHDDASLRELLHRLPCDEFFTWTKEMGILDENGCLTPRAGDASIFL